MAAWPVRQIVEEALSAPAQEATERFGPLPELVHDLRQPLSEIEAIVYYLENSPVGQVRSHELLGKIRNLVEEASAILCRAVLEARTQH